MKQQEKKDKKLEKQDKKKVSAICVCNMEWRGSHDGEWGDCICYTEE